jgi:hypothetical protein
VAREVDAECATLCEAEVNRAISCLPAQVRVTIDGAADAQASAKLKSIAEAHLPAFLRVTLVERARFEAVAGRVDESVARMKTKACVQPASEAASAARARIQAAGAASTEVSRQAGAG